MSNPKQILALERFDSYLESTELLNNAEKLAKYLTKQKTPFNVDQIRPTMSYLIETNELMNSNDSDFRLQLAISFVQAYRLASPGQPINQEDEKYVYRLFILLNKVLEQYGDPEINQDEIVSLVELTNKIGLYGLAVGCGLDKEIFSTLIKIDISESVDNLAKLINDSERIPLPILYGMCDAIITNKNVEVLLFKISEIKQTEFIQGIRSAFQDSSGVQCIKAFEKAASVLKMPPADLFNYIQSDIENEDDQTREAAVKLLTDKFSEIPFDPSNQECILELISRNIDKSAKIRLFTIKFGFEELTKIKNYQKEENSNKNEDEFKSASKRIKNEVWEMAKDRLTDSATEVRCAVLKEIHHLDAKDVKMDDKIISLSLKDKKSDVRAHALKVLLKLYDAKQDKYDWLIEQVIQLYQFSKDIALYGFSILMSNHSLIEVASNLTNRKPLLDILKDTNELRINLPELKNSEESQKIVGKHTDVKKVLKLLKKAPKTFFDQALDPQKRKRLNKVLKEKLGLEDSRLLLGLYQPSPLDVEDLLNCKQLDIVHELGKIFADQLEDEIPKLLNKCNKTDLTILATFKNVDLEDDDRLTILKALIPQINNSKKKSLALKAFAHLYRKNKANDQQLTKIKFEKKEFPERITFYGHFVDKSAYTKNLYDDINKNIDSIDGKTIKYALKIAIAENSARSIDLLVHFRDIYPDITFKYYLLAAQSRELYGYIKPETFRNFAYAYQNKDKEVRSNEIKYLSEALNSSSTPILYLALFALSATDPDDQNVKEAKRQLEAAVNWRRHLMERANRYNSQIMPETAIPYLVNILAHHKDYEKDSEDLSTFSLYLNFFLTPICATTNKFSYIIEMCTFYSLLDDVEDEYTENSKRLFNLAIAIVKELGKKKDWEESDSPNFEFSSRFFKLTDDKAKIKEQLKHSADNMKSPMRPKIILRAGMKARSTKIKLTDIDEDSESEESKPKKPSSKMVKSAPATPKRKSTPAKSKKETRKSSVSVSALSTPKRTTTKSKKKIIIEDDNDDNDKDDSSEKQTPKRKRAASASNSPAPSPRRGKDKNTKTSTKKKQTKTVTKPSPKRKNVKSK